MSMEAKRFALLDGRLRVPARLLRAIGLYGGSTAYVVVGQEGRLTISAQPPSEGTVRRMTVDEHDNLLLRVGKENAGQRYRFCIHTGHLVVLPFNPSDVIESDGKTPLMRAARHGATQQVATLLANGASVNRQDRQGWTALHWAAAHTGKGNDPECQRQAAVARLLLGSGADPNLGDEDGNTALMMVTAIGDEATVRVLLESGANPNHQNEEGRTAWDFAREEEFTAVLSLLARHGAERRW